MNLPYSLWYDLGTPRIILLQSPALGSKQAITNHSNRLHNGGLFTPLKESVKGNAMPFYPVGEGGGAAGAHA